MDIVTFTVGDIRMGMPLQRLALSALTGDSSGSIDDTGRGTVDATHRVVDLRRKFGYPTLAGEQGVRLVTIETNEGLTGLVINRTSPVSIIRDAVIEAPPGTSNLYVTGMIMDNTEPVFLFDWDMILASDTVLDVNDLFSTPAMDQSDSAESKFLDAIAREAKQSDEAVSHQQIRQAAESYGVPLSVAHRLVTFYFSQAQ